MMKSLPTSLSPSLKDQLEAKISNLHIELDKTKSGAKKKVKEHEVQIDNKFEAEKTIKELRVKMLATATGAQDSSH